IRFRGPAVRVVPTRGREGSQPRPNISRLRRVTSSTSWAKPVCTGGGRKSSFAATCAGHTSARVYDFGGTNMDNTILSYGPPPLTVEAADAGLDMIDFIAAAVRGVDLIDVTDLVRPRWRTQPAYWSFSL